MKTDLHISIPAELADSVDRLIRDGRFKDTSDAVVAALRALTKREASVEEHVTAFRAEVLRGLESAQRGELFDTDDVLREIESEYFPHLRGQ